MQPRLLFQDEHLLAVDKPSGWLTVPGREGVGDGFNLRQWLEQNHGPVWPVHRLGRSTSGLVVFARRADSQAVLCAAFEERQVEQVYWALVAGRVPLDSGRIEAALHTARRGKMRPALPGEEGALAAATRYRVLERFERATVLELILETARHHQARVHLRHMGHPLWVDPLYGSTSAPVVWSSTLRTPLHAWRLNLPHPVAPNPLLKIEAPLAEDLQEILQHLRNDDPGRLPNPV